MQKASVMYDPHSKESRGFGFVEMETPEEAELRRFMDRERKRKARQLKRANETPEQAAQRKQTENEKKRKYREEKKLHNDCTVTEEMVETIVNTDTSDYGLSELDFSEPENCNNKHEPCTILKTQPVLDPLEDPLNL